MKKLLLFIGCLVSVSLAAQNPINAHVCKADNFLAGCTVFPRGEGDRLESVEIGGTSYTLNLTWGTTAEFSYEDSVAVGGTYLFGCKAVTLDGKKDSTFRDTLTTTTGCDSIVTLKLKAYKPIVLATEFKEVKDSVCDGEVYPARLRQATMIGREAIYDSIFSDTVPRARINTTDSTIEVYDSIYKYTLKVWPKVVVKDTLRDTVLVDSLPYKWTVYDDYKINCDTAGIYHDTLDNDLGCDSIIYSLSLKVIGHDTISAPIVRDSLCDGEERSTRLRPSVIVIGRDTIYDTTFVDTVFASKVKPFLLDTIHDTVYQYTFTVWPKVVVKDTLRDTVLVDSLPYKWTVYDDHKISCDTAGIYHDTLDNDLGCDSIIYSLSLKVIGHDTISAPIVRDSLCDGEERSTRLRPSVIVIGRDTIYDTTFIDTVFASKVKPFLLDTIHDTVYQYTFTVWPKVVVMPTKYDTALVDTLPYHWHTYTGKTIECYTADTYRDTAKNILNCDSVHYTLELKVIEHDTIEVIVPDSNLCDGDVYKSRWQELTMVGRKAIFDTTFNDTVIVPIVEPFTEDTIHDTIYMYHLYVWPKAVDSLQKDTILVDSLPYRWQVYEGRVISCDTAGTYHDTLDNVLGCDSVHFELELKVIGHDTIKVAVPDSNLCDGDVYKSRWQELTMVGRKAIFDTTFNDTVIVPIVEPFSEDTIHDTIYMYHLYVWPKVVVMPTKYDTALVDTLPYHWHTYTDKTIECYTADTYRDTAKNILNCDSVHYTLELKVIEHETIIHPVEANLCHGDSYTSRNQTVTPYFVGDTTFSDIVPSIMIEPLLMRDSIYAYTLHVQSRYLDSLPAMVKYDSWLLMIHRRSIREDYGIDFKADQVHWYKVEGEVDEYPYGESNDTEVGTGDYYTIAQKMSGKYYALIDVDVTWKAPCASYARTIILDCDNPQPVGPVLSPTYVTPGGQMKLTNLTQGETQLNVFLPAGQLIRTENVKNETEYELHAENASGFYLLQVLNNGQKYVFKYVVTR